MTAIPPKKDPPTIVVCPGAWHSEPCLDPFLQALRKAGYPAQGITLRSVGDASIGVKDDEIYFKSVLEPLIERRQEVVLVLHSYAGFPGTGSITGLDKQSRQADGLDGGIIGVVYLAAFVPVEGESLYGMIGGQWLWRMTDNVRSGVLVLTAGGESS